MRASALHLGRDRVGLLERESHRPGEPLADEDRHRQRARGVRRERRALGELRDELGPPLHPRRLSLAGRRRDRRPGREWEARARAEGLPSRPARVDDHELLRPRRARARRLSRRSRSARPRPSRRRLPPRSAQPRATRPAPAGARREGGIVPRSRPPCAARSWPRRMAIPTPAMTMPTAREVDPAARSRRARRSSPTSAAA